MLLAKQDGISAGRRPRGSSVAGAQRYCQARYQLACEADLHGRCPSV
ncbi:hypothetical protein [Streptomyces avermitilis]